MGAVQAAKLLAESRTDIVGEHSHHASRAIEVECVYLEDGVTDTDGAVGLQLRDGFRGIIERHASANREPDGRRITAGIFGVALDLRVLLRDKVWRQADGMPRVGEAPGAAERWWAVATDPDRRVRLLERLRSKTDVIDLPELPLERWVFLRP
jgi:hypothetical protein